MRFERNQASWSNPRGLYSFWKLERTNLIQQGFGIGADPIGRNSVLFRKGSSNSLRIKAISVKADHFCCRCIDREYLDRISSSRILQGNDIPVGEGLYFNPILHYASSDRNATEFGGFPAVFPPAPRGSNGRLPHTWPVGSNPDNRNNLRRRRSLPGCA